MTPEQIKMQTTYNSVQIDHILQSNERKMSVISVFFFSTTMSTTKMIKDCLHALQTTSKLPTDCVETIAGYVDFTRREFRQRSALGQKLLKCAQINDHVIITIGGKEVLIDGVHLCYDDDGVVHGYGISALVMVTGYNYCHGHRFCKRSNGCKQTTNAALQFCISFAEDIINSMYEKRYCSLCGQLYPKDHGILQVCNRCTLSEMEKPCTFCGRSEGRGLPEHDDEGNPFQCRTNHMTCLLNARESGME